MGQDQSKKKKKKKNDNIGTDSSNASTSAQSNSSGPAATIQWINNSPPAAVDDRANAGIDPNTVDKSEFKYRCDQCKNAYTSAQDLQIHRERRGHPEKPFAAGYASVSNASSSSAGGSRGSVAQSVGGDSRGSVGAASQASSTFEFGTHDSAISAPHTVGEIDIPETFGVQNEWELNPNELELGRQLGQGAFGVVFAAIFRGRQVAVKQLKSAENQSAELNAEEAKAFRKEAQLMEKLRPHRNVVGLVGVITNSQPNAIVTDFAANGSLDVYLKERRGQLSPSHRISMCVDACEGVMHLHAHKLIHRDIAARNFLMHADGRILVADFGMSRLLPPEARGNVTKQTTGPLRYLSIESLTSSAYSTASDVWAFGIFLWEIETGAETPYKGLGLAQVAMQVVMEDLRLSEPPNCLPGLYELMRSCWIKAVKERARMADIHGGLLQIQAQCGRLDEYFVPKI